MTSWEHVREAVRVIREQWAGAPEVGLVLGTGLGSLTEEIAAEAVFSYDELPHFPRSTAPGHTGRLVLGKLDATPVAAMDGRFHLYEGHSPAAVTFPIRVLRELGCELLIVSNAAGGLNPLHAKGDVVVIDDHINLMGINPLIGPNDDRLGPRFPDLSRPYDPELQRLALEAARDAGLVLHRGVYAGVVGPNLETRAEYRILRTLGADVVGMSTIPEVLVAIHAGMKVLGFSVITDLCLPDALEPALLEDILAIARATEPKLRQLVREVLRRRQAGD